MASLKLYCQLQRRFSSARAPHKSQIKQVSRLDFAESLDEIKARISESQFVAISLTTSGTSSSSWHSVSSIDTRQTAYLKSKHAAERFQIFQLSICPFTICGSKVTAYPYGFHLFPREEQNTGAPCYSFSCQSSVLKSLASQGFDFNTCIYNGISYLSREQESAALNRLGFLIPVTESSSSLSSRSVADSIFCERTKSLLRHWRNTSLASTNTDHDPLIRSLRKVLYPSEDFHSRSSISISINSERQASLVAEIIQEFHDDLVPLIVKGKEGIFEAVRVVLTTSNEDKALLLKEIEESEEKLKKQLRGFREVIEFISDSQKPLVSRHSLNDLIFVYSKFVGSLPSAVDEFEDLTSSIFPHVIDVNNLMNGVSPQRRGRNLSMAMSHLKNHFFAPFSLEIPNQVSLEDDEVHGHPIVMTAHLLAKLFHILKICPKSDQDGNIAKALTFENLQSTDGSEVKIWSNNTRNVKCANVVFLWGFGDLMTARMVKNKLQESSFFHNMVFYVRLLEKNCAVIVFSNHDQANEFMLLTKSEADAFRETFPEGLKAAGYELYDKVCKFGLWDAKLEDSLEKALNLDSNYHDASSISSDWLINFDDL